MNVRLVRHFLLAGALGFLVGAIFHNPPIQPHETLVAIVMSGIAWIIDFSDRRSSKRIRLLILGVSIALMVLALLYSPLDNYHGILIVVMLAIAFIAQANDLQPL